MQKTQGEEEMQKGGGQAARSRDHKVRVPQSCFHVSAWATCSAVGSAGLHFLQPLALLTQCLQGLLSS